MKAHTLGFVVQVLVAIAVPLACFYTTYQLAMKATAQETSTPLDSAIDPSTGHQIAPDSAPTDPPLVLATVPEWNLAGWKEAIQALSNQQLREFITENYPAAPTRIAIARLGELEGEAALDFLDSLARPDDDRDYWTMRYRACLGWLEADARAAILTLAGNRNRSEMVPELIASLCQRDPELAAELVDHPQIKQLGERPRIITNLARSMGQALPEVGLTWFESLAESDRRFAMRTLLYGQGSKHPEATAKLLSRLPPAMAREHLLALMNTWGKSDPRAAIGWSMSLAQNDSSWDARRTALISWGEIEPAGAWGYLQELDPADRLALLEETHQHGHQSTLAHVLIERLDGDGREELLTMLEESSNAEVRYRAGAAALLDLARTDPRRAIDGAQELSSGPVTIWDGGLENFVLRSHLEALAMDRPGEALALSLTFPQDSRKDALMLSGRLWAQRDPEIAREQILALEPGSDRDAAFAGYVQQLSVFDPQQAATEFADFVAQGGSGEVRLSPAYGSDLSDVVTRQLVGNLFDQDPQAAGEWALQLDDPKIRDQALQLLYQRWRRFGESTAAQQLRALGISQEQMNGEEG